MNLRELKREVEAAFDRAVELGESPDEIEVSLQIEHPNGAAVVWARESVELHYDNNCNASGVVLLGSPLEQDLGG